MQSAAEDGLSVNNIVYFMSKLLHLCMSHFFSTHVFRNIVDKMPQFFCCLKCQKMDLTKGQIPLQKL